MARRPIPRKKERLGEFINRLAAAPPAATFDEAYELLCSALNGVEDELTGIPYNPDNWRTDQRMYPPQMDRMSDVEGKPELKRFNSFGHYTLVGTNGAVEIRITRTEEVICTKPGADGKKVEDL